MRIAAARLRSTTPYSQSKCIDPQTVPKRDKETSEAFEQRCWRYRVHKNEAGYVIIPGVALKNCIAEAAKYAGLKIPGRGKATYTKIFEAGVLVPEPLVLPLQWADVEYERLFLPSDGVRGSGKRVWKYMPRIDYWEGTVNFYVFDETITEEVFRTVLDHAGKFIGVGTFRPRNNGVYGRFTTEELTWNDPDEEEASK